MTIVRLWLSPGTRLTLVFLTFSVFAEMEENPDDADTHPPPVPS